MAPTRRRVKRDLSFAIKELVGCKWKDGNFYEATVVDIRRSQYIKSFLHHSLKKSFKDRIKIRYIEDGIVETVSVDKRKIKMLARPVISMKFKMSQEEDGGVEVVRHPGSSIATRRSGKACATAPPLPFWKNVKLFKKAVMKRFAADTEDWVLHEVSPVARADDYVKEQHKASLLEDSKIVDTETEDDSKRHRYAASKFACESDEDAQRAGGSKRHKK
ncbi:hypothetical protein CAPTEDRAFT_200667 [Capitella teleta]|uniref:Tudor domain-containing protein n=1 Tax=Capitella teleta TaxID=283909 RepID=R7U078_CAPTE|nr:hypothetical protein CAPTEDRAFT_200667 [Capitella teleta]|eukprot:ELT99262.1 hypothetical protein CAPTEDRAFT_200667 [Capitella teleta]